MLSQALSHWVFKAPKDEESTASLWNSLKWLNILRGIFFSSSSYSAGYMPHFSVYAPCLSFPHCASLQRAQYQPLRHKCWGAATSPPPQLSLPWALEALWPLLLPWPPSNLPFCLCLSHTGAPKHEAISRWGLTSAERRGTKTCSHLLSAPALIVQGAANIFCCQNMPLPHI